MKRIYSQEQENAIVLESLLGLAKDLDICQKYEITITQLKAWTSRFRAETGFMAIEEAEDHFEEQIKNYTAAFKLKMVHRYLSGQDDYEDVAKVFGIPNPILLAQWVYQFRQGKKFRDGKDQVEWINFPSRKLKEEEERAVIADLASGKVYRQVAHEHRISLYQVQHIVKKYKNEK